MHPENNLTFRIFADPEGNHFETNKSLNPQYVLHRNKENSDLKGPDTLNPELKL